MNSLFTQESINATILAVSATLIAHGLIKVLSKIQWPSGETIIGWQAKAIRKFLPMLLNVLRYAFIFWFFALQLHPLLTLPGPPSRTEVGLIAFWVFWSSLLFVILMFDLRLWKVDRLIKRT